jgi:hypothetical protein
MPVYIPSVKQVLGVTCEPACVFLSTSQNQTAPEYRVIYNSSINPIEVNSRPFQK